MGSPTRKRHDSGEKRQEVHRHPRPGLWKRIHRPGTPEGWEADVDKLYHSTVVAPPHQYLAWYAWVNTVFNADAQVHIGRHATYEWLPRKQVALSSFDFSQICAGTKPSVYIYIMDGVGEGIQSKRRGYAVIIDHLTPPMKTTQLYGDLLELRPS